MEESLLLPVAFLSVVEVVSHADLPLFIRYLIGHSPDTRLGVVGGEQIDAAARDAGDPSVVEAPPPEPALHYLHVPDKTAAIGKAGLPHKGAVAEDPHHDE